MPLFNPHFYPQTLFSNRGNKQTEHQFEFSLHNMKAGREKIWRECAIYQLQFLLKVQKKRYLPFQILMHIHLHYFLQLHFYGLVTGGFVNSHKAQCVFISRQIVLYTALSLSLSLSIELDWSAYLSWASFSPAICSLTPSFHRAGA